MPPAAPPEVTGVLPQYELYDVVNLRCTALGAPPPLLAFSVGGKQVWEERGVRNVYIYIIF